MTSPIQLPAFMPQASADVRDAATDAYTNINGLESLKQGGTRNLNQVAQQVEAMFLQMMLKSMREATPEGGLFDSSEGKMYQEMFDKQVSLEMSKHQGLGLGDLLMRQIQDAPLTSNRSGAASPAEFAQAILPGIRRAAAKYGLNATGMLAQAALETGWGQRVARNIDGSSSNNVFGVKADANWTGARTSAQTVEYDGLVAKRGTQSFRSYASTDAAVEDYARLLATSPRYGAARAASADAESYVRAVGAAGYATDPEYANKLKQLVNSAVFRDALGPRLAAL